MKCAEILLRLEDYSYGELPDLDSIAIAAHLRDCQNCSEQYQIILHENEVFADYLPDLEVNPNLWNAVQERISPLAETTSPQIYNPNTLVISPFIQLLDNRPIWIRLAGTLKITLQDFIANPSLFFQQLFQDDSLVVRDKKNWKVGKVVASVLWFFSVFSYAAVVFQEPIKSVNQTEQFEKIVDLAPLLSPTKSLEKPKSNSGDPADPGSSGSSGSLGSSGDSSKPEKVATNQKPANSAIKDKQDATNKPSIIVPSYTITLPTVSTTSALPDTAVPNLTLGVPSNINSDGSGSGNGKTPGDGTGIGKGVDISGGGYGVGGGQSTGGEVIYSADDVGVIPARILSKQKPKYTEEARREKIQGIVVLSVVLNRNGTVTNIQVIRGLGYGLDEEAIKTASQVKFIPATRNGVRVGINARLEYSFTLF